MAVRNVINTVTGSHQVDGAGVHLVRVVGYRNVKDFDPFLMLDAFDSKDPNDYIKGFPWHPHRGIETVTYLIKGKIEHEDSLGNKGVINAGECQWMTAGSGIMHQEMPQASEHMLGFQLWVNLPQKDKMTDPCYCDIRKEMVPVVKDGDAEIRIISGEYGGKSGVKGRHVDALLLDVQVAPGTMFRMQTDPLANLFIYIIEGSARFGDGSAGMNGQEVIPAKTAVLFDKAEEFSAQAGEAGIRFALFAGRQLNEPVAWGGPIVMNTREELNLAFQELESGTFIKKKGEYPTDV